MKAYTLHVSGTHCASCKILIEDVLNDQDYISRAQVDLKNQTLRIETVSEKSPEELVDLLTEKVKPNGYTVSVERVLIEKQKDDVIWKALPIGLVFLILFFVLQKSGLLNLGFGGTTPPAM